MYIVLMTCQLSIVKKLTKMVTDIIGKFLLVLDFTA